MNIQQIIQKVNQSISWEMEENKKNNVQSIDQNNLINMYAMEVCHEQLGSNNPETQQLILSYVDEPELYIQLKKLNGKLNYQQYSQLNSMSDTAKTKIANFVANQIINSGRFSNQ